MTEDQIAYKRHLVEVLGIEEPVAESMAKQNDSGFGITQSKTDALLEFKLWTNTKEGADYWRAKFKEAINSESQEGQDV